MKLYEILNEKYLGRKFKIVKDGIESELIRNIAVNNNGKYGYVMEHSGIWNLSEGNLLCDIELLETEEEKYKKFIKNNLKIVNNYIGSEQSIVVLSNYNDLELFKKNIDSIYIRVNGGSIGLSFEDFDLIVNYVEKLKEFKK